VYDTQFKKRKGHPPKTLRLDPVQLAWVEKHSASSGLNFSEIVRVAIAQLVESKVIGMGNFQKLLDQVAIQSRQVEEIVLAITRFELPEASFHRNGRLLSRTYR